MVQQIIHYVYAFVHIYKNIYYNMDISLYQILKILVSNFFRHLDIWQPCPCPSNIGQEGQLQEKREQ